MTVELRMNPNYAFGDPFSASVLFTTHLSVIRSQKHQQKNLKSKSSYRDLIRIQKWFKYLSVEKPLVILQNKFNQQQHVRI